MGLLDKGATHLALCVGHWVEHRALTWKFQYATLGNRMWGHTGFEIEK